MQIQKKNIPGRVSLGKGVRSMNHWWRREKPQRSRRKPVHGAAITGSGLMPKAVRSVCKDLSVGVIANTD